MRLAILALSAAVVVASAAAAEAPAAPVLAGWVKESNDDAKALLEVQARFSPETASYLGVDGFDDQVADLKPKLFERTRKANVDAIKDLKAKLDKATDPAVRQDLEILIQSAQDNIDSGDLNDRMVLPYFDPARLVFSGINILLDPRVSKERQALAVTRVKRYAGLVDGPSIIKLARDRIEERLDDRKLLRPYKGQVEQDLSDAPGLMAGVRELFSHSGLKGWEDAVAKLEQQSAEHGEWVRKVILPQARAEARLPPELYADNLKQFGLDIGPQPLMQRALLGFAEIQQQMNALAPRVAKELKLKSTDYRDVIRELKKKQVSGPGILTLYQKRIADIEEIVRRERIVTLPERKARVRLASPAESAMVPAPNMRPPRLIGNTGEYGEFILPLVVPGKEGREALKMDDFTYDAVAWTLASHEARPGHELQFSAMVEKGVSIARAVFAFNSVNVEGWGLYAESEMLPYMPLAGQLCSLQARLQRAARAFLDPMVNLGMMTPEQAKAFLMREVVLSEGMSQQEADRYSFRAPGQATAYFYGYMRLMETRERAQLALGEKFDRKAFNDFVLSQGMLPPKLLEKAVLEDFVKR